MRRVTAILSAAAVVVMTVGLLAQAKPNFAGKWTMDAPPAGAAPAAPPAGGGGAPGGGGGGGGRGGGRGGGGGWGMEATITQTATTLTVEYMQGQNPIKLTYKLDGSDSTNTMPGRGGAAGTDQVSKAMWDGATLKITTTMAQGEQTKIVSLVAGKLTIATQTGAGAPTTVTYSKGM